MKVFKRFVPRQMAALSSLFGCMERLLNNNQMQISSSDDDSINSYLFSSAYRHLVSEKFRGIALFDKINWYWLRYHLLFWSISFQNLLIKSNNWSVLGKYVAGIRCRNEAKVMFNAEFTSDRFVGEKQSRFSSRRIRNSSFRFLLLHRRWFALTLNVLLNAQRVAKLHPRRRKERKEKGRRRRRCYFFNRRSLY